MAPGRKRDRSPAKSAIGVPASAAPEVACGLRFGLPVSGVCPFTGRTWEAGMADGTSITARAQITAIVEALLAKRSGATSVAADHNLTDAGLTSLDMVNLM